MTFNGNSAGWAQVELWQGDAQVDSRQADQNGNYSFHLLLPGNYTVKAFYAALSNEKSGTVHKGQVTVLDIDIQGNGGSGPPGGGP